MTSMNILTRRNVEKAYSYEEYRSLINHLLEEGKTTGPIQSEAFIDYTKMNHQRMKRWDKKATISDDLKAKIEAINEKQTWVVLSEAWCGDAAHNLPIIAKMAELNPNIELKIVLRDENLDLMDQYLTNGGRSIPKLIAYTDNNQELFTWGPRPKELQELYMDLKKHPEKEVENKITIQQWYNKNKTVTLQEEFKNLLG